MAKPFDRTAYAKKQSDLEKQLLAEAKTFLIDNLANHQLSQEKLLELIRFRLQFPTRSFKNTMLMAMQMSGAHVCLATSSGKRKDE